MWFKKKEEPKKKYVKFYREDGATLELRSDLDMEDLVRMRLKFDLQSLMGPIKLPRGKRPLKYMRNIR
jgi:hypothetical protein